MYVSHGVSAYGVDSAVDSPEALAGQGRLVLRVVAVAVEHRLVHTYTQQHRYTYITKEPAASIGSGRPTFQEACSACLATSAGAWPFSMASANSLKAAAVIVASTVFTNDTF